MKLVQGLTLAAALLMSTGPSKADGIAVVASFSILGDLVDRVGGERVTVTTLVGPNGDAHVYQPTPADAAAVAAADLVVVNGLGFEGFLERLTAAAGYDGPVVVASEAIEARAASEGGEHHEGEAEAEDHDHGPVDPHAWQDLSNGIAYVTAIEEGLCTVDPDGCPGYGANADALRADLSALDADIRARIQAVPAERRRVITGHDAFGYFGAAYGVTFLSPQGVSTDAEASARDVAELIGQIRDTGVRMIFVESISDPRLVEQIARETGAVVGGSLYSDALSPPGEGADSYAAMMRHNADAMLAAMRTEP